MELPEFKRKYIIKSKILGLPPDIIRILFSYLSGIDINNILEAYPKLKEKYFEEHKVKIITSNHRINYSNYYKINKYIIEGENVSKYDKFTENIYIMENIL